MNYPESASSKLVEDLNSSARDFAWSIGIGAQAKTSSLFVEIVGLLKLSVLFPTAR